ncbi:retrovirus-related pol polyprotein from transposon TNT 1-94 [Tanacetum coccineum]
MAKASPTQAWLWHRRISHLNFDTINLLSKKDIVNGLPKLKYVKVQLYSSCEMGKAKRSSFKTKIVPSSKGRLNLLHMDLCGPMQIESINEKKYILVIVDDYSRYTWTHFLRSNNETPEVLKDFLMLIQRNLQAYVITVRTNKGTEDGENLDKMKEKGDPCNMVGYSTQSKGYRVYNKRTRFLVESIHISFDEIKELSQATDYDNSGPRPNYKRLLPLFEEYFTAYNQSVLKPSALSDNSKQQDTHPTLNSQTTIEPTTTTTNVNAEENNINQAEDAQFEPYEFINPLCTPVQEVAESSSCNVDTSNMRTFYQRHRSDYHWTKNNPFALTVSTAEPNNIKEAMADHAWIEEMQEKLH